MELGTTVRFSNGNLNVGDAKHMKNGAPALDHLSNARRECFVYQYKQVVINWIKGFSSRRSEVQILDPTVTASRHERATVGFVTKRELMGPNVALRLFKFQNHNCE